MGVDTKKKGKKKNRIQIQRSTEVGMAVEYPRQASRDSTDGSMNSYSSEGKSVSLASLSLFDCSGSVILNAYPV